MSTMEDEKEIQAHDDYTRRMGVESDHHLIRSHRAPRQPRAFPIRRILFTFTLVAMAAGFINTSAASLPPEPLPAETLSVPESLRWVDPRASRDHRVDTGSEVDTAVRTANPERSSREEDSKKVILPPVPPVEKAIAYALAQVGKPYRWAQAGPTGFDCSGLVLAAFKQIGIKLPHYTGTMIRYGKAVSKGSMQRGDIVFPTAGHVAIYLGNGMMVAASSSAGKVRVQKVYGFYAARRLV